MRRVLILWILVGLATPALAQAPRSSDEARRVVMNLGLGSYVAVTFRSSDTVRGYIRVIADDHFALRVDRTPVLVDIAYGDVQWVGPVPQLVPRPSRAPRAPSIGKTLGIIVVLAYLGAMAFCGQPANC